MNAPTVSTASRLPAGSLVSIIVPSYNQGRFIRETLTSILAQSYRPLEVLVIDGASSDQTVEVLKTFSETGEVRWWSEPDSGVVEAVNKGFARAQGAVGAIQSADDAYLPEAVARAVNVLTARPELGLVFGDVVKTDAEGREVSRTQLPPFSLEAVLSLETWIPQPSAFFRMDLAKALGGWRAEVPYAPDTDLWFRMMFQAGVGKLDTPLALRRMHAAQRDKQGDNIIRDYRRVLADLAPLQTGPRRLKRAAAAGMLLMENRYRYAESGWPKLGRNWAAVVLWPALVRRLGLSGLLPGWMAFVRWGSRVRRGLRAWRTRPGCGARV